MQVRDEFFASVLPGFLTNSGFSQKFLDKPGNKLSWLWISSHNEAIPCSLVAKGSSNKKIKFFFCCPTNQALPPPLFVAGPLKQKNFLRPPLVTLLLFLLLSDFLCVFVRPSRNLRSANQPTNLINRYKQFKFSLIDGGLCLYSFCPWKDIQVR